MRLKVFIFSIELLTTKSVEETFDQVFKNFNCAAQENIAFGFVFKKRRWIIQIF